jgi:hypothetical protein
MPAHKPLPAEYVFSSRLRNWKVGRSYVIAAILGQRAYSVQKFEDILQELLHSVLTIRKITTTVWNFQLYTLDNKKDYIYSMERPVIYI